MTDEKMKTRMTVAPQFSSDSIYLAFVLFLAANRTNQLY